MSNVPELRIKKEKIMVFIEFLKEAEKGDTLGYQFENEYVFIKVT